MSIKAAPKTDGQQEESQQQQQQENGAGSSQQHEVPPPSYAASTSQTQPTENTPVNHTGQRVYPQTFPQQQPHMYYEATGQAEFGGGPNMVILNDAQVKRIARGRFFGALVWAVLIYMVIGIVVEGSTTSVDDGRWYTILGRS